MHWDENGFEVCHGSCLVLVLDVKNPLKLNHTTSHFRNAICLGSMKYICERKVKS